MREWIRVGISMCFMFVAVMMMSEGIIHRHQLWTGIETKVVDHYLPAPVSDSGVPINTSQMKLGPGEFDTGNLLIQEYYETKDNHLPSGDYQVLDANNKVWMMRLCPAENNGVLPHLYTNSVVNVVYSKGDNCYRFLSAQLIKAAPPK